MTGTKKYKLWGGLVPGDIIVTEYRWRYPDGVINSHELVFVVDFFDPPLEPKDWIGIIGQHAKLGRVEMASARFEVVRILV